ncbi:hypothetical protein MAR_017554, partial [Mya arenaria]
MVGVLLDNISITWLVGVLLDNISITGLVGVLLDNISITRLNISNNSLGLRAAQSIGHVMVVTNNITHLNM